MRNVISAILVGATVFVQANIVTESACFAGEPTPERSSVGSASPAAPIVNLALYRASLSPEANVRAAAPQMHEPRHESQPRGDTTAKGNAQREAPASASPLAPSMTLARYFREVRTDHDAHQRSGLERAFGLGKPKQAALERRVDQAEDSVAEHIVAYAPQALKPSRAAARFLVERMVFKKEKIPVRYADSARDCLSIVRDAIHKVEQVRAKASVAPGVEGHDAAVVRRAEADLKALWDIESELKASFEGYLFSANW